MPQILLFPYAAQKTSLLENSLRNIHYLQMAMMSILTNIVHMYLSINYILHEHNKHNIESNSLELTVLS